MALPEMRQAGIIEKHAEVLSAPGHVVDGLAKSRLQQTSLG